MKFQTQIDLAAWAVLMALPCAQAETPNRYTCLRAMTPITIDGRLDDAAWRKAAWTDYFIDIEGDGKPKPRFRTRVKMLWDDGYLYIGAELEEPQVWATLTEHDSVIFHDNDFEVFLNPSGDGRNYFEFEINALNTGWDLFLNKPYREGGKADNSWDIPGLKTAVEVEGTINNPNDSDRGWTGRWHSRGARSVRGRGGASASGRGMAHQFLTGGVAHENRGREVRQTSGAARGQLGMVAAGHHQHARAGVLGAGSIRGRRLE